MVEGMSVRAISRHTGADKNTVLTVLRKLGEKCRRLFDARITKLRPRFVQLDELWTFVHTKEKRLSEDDPQAWGDSYTWTALDSETKLILSFYIGKRDAVSAYDRSPFSVSPAR